MNAENVHGADFYYVGAFDDEIQRYKKTDLNLTTINETLSQAALYSGRLLINDGYLMLYPAGRRALVDRTASPLLDLIDAGYIQLYSRNGGRLVDLPLEMQHIETYRDLVRSPEWENLKRNLQDLEDHLKGKAAFENWPKVNVGIGFRNLVNLALARLDHRSFEGILTINQIECILDEFNSTLKSDPTLPARQVWRQTCERPDFAVSESGKSFLHWLGIEAYQYNLAMVSYLNDPSRRPGLITRYSCFFNNVRELPLCPKSGGIGFSEIPRPVIPRGIAREALHGGSFLREVVTFGTDLNQKKHVYLDAVQAALRDKSAVPELKKACNEYSSSLATLLAPYDVFRQAGESIRTPLEIVVKTSAISGLAGGAILGSSIGGVPGALLGAAIGWVSSRVVVSGARKKLDTAVPIVVDLMETLEDFAETVPTLSNPYQGPQWFASFMLRSDAAKEHAQALPQFKSS